MAKARRNRVQLVRLRVSFNKPVTAQEAARMVASAIRGETFDGTQQREDGASEFTVRSVAALTPEPSHG